MAKFVIEDTVRLKSGGPVMVVTETVNIDTSVEWFDKAEHRQSGTFLEDTLEKVQEVVPGRWDRC